jgi:hypothetical protein
MSLAGICMLLVTLNVFREFPSFGYWLIAIGLVYLAGLFVLPQLWLIVLPLATVGLDLATYTGRFLFNEYDLLFITTIAFGLISGRFSLEFLRINWVTLLIVSYCLIMLSGLSAWGVFIEPPEASVSNPYYSSEYGYKVIKGLLWALMLAPMWIDLYRTNSGKATNWFVIGQCLAALALGLVLLWERGTLGVLLSGTAWYHMVSSLLDLSSSYRTTGIFSDMHTGGEVVDGVILLLLPAVLYGIFRGGNTFLRIVALAAFGSLAYCTTVGFTRATYVSFFVGIAAFVALYLISLQRISVDKRPQPYGLYAATIMLAFCAAYVSFFFAGSFGVAAYVGLALSAFAGGWLLMQNRWLAVGFWLVAGGICLAVAVDAHYSSRWVDHSGRAIFIITGLLLAFYVFANVLFSRLKGEPGFNRFIFTALLIMLPAGFSLAFGGYKFNERMDSVGKDLGSRMTHWRNVAQSAPEGMMGQLFGHGPGSFPANYAYSFPEIVSAVGSFSILQDGPGAYLSLGPGEDLAFGQRVGVMPNTTYDLSLNIRAYEPGKIAIFVCERNLIFASNFMANCEIVSVKFKATGNEFKRFSVTLNTDRVGKRHWLSRWPTTLYLKNFSKEAVVDIDEVLFSLNGDQLLKNPRFLKGGDNWFFYNDFAHLPWHIKNTYLQAWYNLGWVGLGLFLCLGCVVVISAMKEGSPMLHTVFASAVVAIAAFGLFGSPLDSSRVSWLFYFYIFAALLGGREEGYGAKTSGTGRSAAPLEVS